MGPPPSRLGGLALDVLPGAVLEVVLVVGVCAVGSAAGPRVRRVVAELHFLRVLRGHHLLLGGEKGLQLPQAIRGEPAGVGELHLRRGREGRRG